MYQAKVGSTLRDTDAEVLGQVIAGLADNGVVKAEALVDAARPVTSPAHDYFEWDDGVAAEKYRLEQAGYYVRSIEIIHPEYHEPVRAFHNVHMTVNDESVRGYARLEIVESQEELLVQVIAEAKAELVGWKRRYSFYKKLRDVAEGPVQQAIEQL